MLGYVYIMSNESMPGLYKIGCTSKDPAQRADDLYTTGVPTPFIIEYCIYIENYENVEKLIHRSLLQYNYNKEFFKHDLVKCILCMKKIAIEQSSYKERYRTNNLKEKVDAVKDKYFREIREQEYREKLKIEKEKAEKLQKEKELKEKSDRESSNAMLGCAILLGAFILGIYVYFETKDKLPMIIIIVIGMFLCAKINKDN